MYTLDQQMKSKPTVIGFIATILTYDVTCESTHHINIIYPAKTETHNLDI